MSTVGITALRDPVRQVRRLMPRDRWMKASEIHDYVGMYARTTTVKALRVFVDEGVVERQGENETTMYRMP